MKTNLILLIVLLLFFDLYAQEKENPWSFEAGINAVDVYPVGENSPQGDYFNEFFNANDHWNLGTYLAVTRKLTNRFSLTIRGSVNEISKWGQLDADASVLVDNLKYFGIDGMINYNILKDVKFKPFVGVGGGYTLIEEGPYNTFSNNQGIIDNYAGAATINGVLGVKYQISERFELNLQAMYKHAINETLTKHWQHGLGISYNLGKKKNSTEKKEEPLDLDTDGDGIIDKYDLCPSAFGIKEYAGCPDTDGDGVPDSIDKCVNKVGDVKNNGCPLPDADGDGIADNIDKCPNEVGTKNNNGCPKLIEPTKEVMSTLNNYAKTILFDAGKFSFKQKTHSILKEIISILNNYPKTDFIIEGHTDSIGDATSNLLLSRRRANAVKNYFISNHIDADRLFTAGFGEEYPIDSNTSRFGRINNRRVEVKLKK